MKKARLNLSQFYEAHPKAKKVLKGFGYIFSEKILKFAIGFVVHALVARHLGPEQFGKLSYVIKTVNVFYTFSLFGVDEIVVKYLLDKHHSLEDILKSVFVLRLFMSVVGFIVFCLLLLFARSESNGLTLITFFYGIQIIVQAFNVFELDFQSRLSFRPLFWANNLSNFFASGLRLLGVWLKMGLPYFVSTYLAGELLLKLIIQWRLNFKMFSGKFLPDVARSIAKSSWPHFLAAFIVLMDQRISLVFIKEYLNGEALGNYSVAVTLVDLWLFFTIANCSALFPTIINAFTDQKKNYESRIQYLTDVMVWIALFFLLGVYLTADLIIAILYGEKYVSAPDIIRWYALVTIPLFFNLARVKWMSLENELLNWLKLCSLAIVCNFIFHRWLVPIYGVKGAIWSYLSSQIVANLLCSFWMSSVRKSGKIFLRTFLLPQKLLKKIV